MIDDLDRTLETLLKRGLPTGLVDQVSISFHTPNDQFPPTTVSLPAVNLFLYDVRENRDLRVAEWTVEKLPNGTARQTRPPVRIDCSYLITAWPSEASTTPPYDEHRLLSEVMRVMLRHPTLPAAVLQGSLVDQGVAPYTVSLQSGHFQNLGEFWQALGGRPRAALNYTVTLSLKVHDPVDLGPVAGDRVVRMEPSESGG
jgi:hypothetical protein